MGRIGTRIEHTAIYVRDLEGARSFFERYLGAEAGGLYCNETTGFRSYFLSFGDGDGARLEIMWRPELADAPGPQPHLGYAHLAFSLESEQAVDELTDRLAADGFEVESGPRVTGDGYYESCILGIEGIRFELTA